MIFVSKLFTVLLLPPGCFILALIVLIFFVRRRIKLFLGLIVFLLYAMSIQPVSDLLLKPLENAWPPLSENTLRIGRRLLSYLAAERFRALPRREKGGTRLPQTQ